MSHLNDEQFHVCLGGLHHILDPVVYRGVWSTIYPEGTNTFSHEINYQDMLRNIQRCDDDYLHE